MGFSTGCFTFFIARHPPPLGFREHFAVNSALVILDYFEIKHYFFFQFRTYSSRVEIMEPLLATTQAPYPAALEPVPIVGGQALNDRAQRDRTRDRRGRLCRKRLKVLDIPHKVAFRGWTDVPEPWTFKQCK